MCKKHVVSAIVLGYSGGLNADRSNLFNSFMADVGVVSMSITVYSTLCAPFGALGVSCDGWG